MENVKSMCDSLNMGHSNELSFFTRMEIKAMLGHIDKQAITDHFVKLQKHLQSISNHSSKS